MEKRKPHYPLRDIQTQMVDVPSLRLTNSARNSIVFELGWELEDAVRIVQGLHPANFYKSMTTTQNHRVWQDVYHATWRKTGVYLKFQRHESTYYFTISFKEL
jgi:motility quorum-sensing regulator / GCU-specific mRNA interferase toxin